MSLLRYAMDMSPRGEAARKALARTRVPVWRDDLGREWRVPQILGRLKFRVPCAQALRRFVFIRDNFTCQKCGIRPESIPVDYDGKEAVIVALDRLGCTCIVMDHIVSRRNGGGHHPRNLQTLCDPCNARKANLVDRVART